MSEAQFDSLITDAIQISQQAQSQLIQLVEEEEDIAGVRIFVSGGGCGGMNYGMTFVEHPTEFDCKWEQNDLTVYVDAVALNFLEGLEIDLETRGLNQSFVFKNVFASTGGSGVCGTCGAAGGGCA